MTENGAKNQNKFFQFNWEALNWIAGIKYAIAALVAAVFTLFTDFDFIVILIGALLTRLTDIPGTIRNRITGMFVFGVAAVVMVWLGAVTFSSVFWFTIAIFAVTFVFTLAMAISSRGYMVGWVIIILFFSIAPMASSGEPSLIIVDLLIGVGLVIAITLLWPKGIGPWGSSGDAPPPESGGNEDQVYILVYALTVAVVMAIATIIGLNLLTVGAVWVANGAFFVLGPSTRQSWVQALGRAMGVIVGIVLAHLLIQFVDSMLVLMGLWTFFGFLALATLNASYPVMVGSYTAGMTISWALLGSDVGQINLSSNERIIAEAVAIVLAILATAFLQWWSKHRQVETFVEAEIAT